MGRWFESNAAHCEFVDCRLQIDDVTETVQSSNHDSEICNFPGCPYRLARPRTRPFQGCNAGSNPAGDATVNEGLQKCSPFLLFVEASMHICCEVFLKRRIHSSPGLNPMNNKRFDRGLFPEPPCKLVGEYFKVSLIKPSQHICLDVDTYLFV